MIIYRIYVKLVTYRLAFILKSVVCIFGPKPSQPWCYLATLSRLFKILRAKLINFRRYCSLRALKSMENRRGRGDVIYVCFYGKGLFNYSSSLYEPV